MSKSPIIIKHFKEQHYATFFNPNTGFFARVEEPGHLEPFWSQHGPELLDISITNWCDRGCSLCYRKSDESGHHLSLDAYELVMQQAHEMHVLQVALGGGNPNQHPNFCEILRMTKEYGIVPNYTTNGRGLTDDVLRATKEYCGAVAVSAYYPYEETRQAVNALSSYQIKTNIHFILSSQSINTAISWLESPPDFMDKINALIFLNYKPVGRYHSHKLLLKNGGRKLEYFFKLATETKHIFRIGFDTCTVTGIAAFTNTPAICHEGCDAGRFSMFISEDMKMYPCSFMVEAGYEGVPIVGNNMRVFWRNGEPFRRIRSRLASGGCIGCRKVDLCLGGCPLFPEINLCPTQQGSAEHSSISQVIPIENITVIEPGERRP